MEDCAMKTAPIVIPWISEAELAYLHIEPSDRNKDEEAFVSILGPAGIFPTLDCVRVFLHCLAYGWRTIFDLAHSVYNRYGLDSNDNGISYADEFEEWEMEKEDYFEEVVMYTPDRSQVQMSLVVFERLMLRFFYAAMESAHRYKDPILHDPRFVQFIKDINQIEQRLEEESKKVA